MLKKIIPANTPKKIFLTVNFGTCFEIHTL